MLTRSARWSWAAALGLAIPAALARPAPAADPFYGEADVALGDDVACTLAAGETHLFSFYAVAGTRVDAALRPAAGSTVLPALRLTRPGGEPVLTGRALGRRGAVSRLSRFALPYSGWFVLEVSSLRGSGAYELTTRPARPPRIARVVPDAAGDQEYRFDAVAGATLSIDLVPRGPRSGARPIVRELRAPDGAPVAFETAPRGAGVLVIGALAPADGEHTLLWRNDGRTGDVVLRIRMRIPEGTTFRRILPAASGIPTGLVDHGAPRAAARDGYVGSGACGRCHDEIFRDWSRTAHHLAARPWNQPGLAGLPVVADANRNGRDDFRDGLDLATAPAFSDLGANAPKLSYSEAATPPYRITIGAVTYAVERTMGGNGVWRQQFLLRAGSHLVPAPVAYEEATRTWSLDDRGTWYDDDGVPLHASAASVPASRSFEARCSGCHNTGETVRFDAASGEYVTGHVDFSVGCEQCHGPGGEHVRERGDRTKILNPRSLADGTKAGLERANDVCGRCHTRGDAADPFPGTAVRAEYPYRADEGVGQAGDEAARFLRTTTSPDDFWGRKTEPFPAVPGDTFVGARTSRQQATDFSSGAHAPDDDGDAPACFDCHDPHSSRNPRQIAASMRVPGVGIGVASRAAAADGVGIHVPTRAADGSLCLACHAGRPGPFAGLGPADVATIGGGTPSAGVVQSVVRHMADRGMAVDASLYDPAGTGVGSCISCHMPLLASSGPAGEDAAGLHRGDLRSHTFRTVPAAASRLHLRDGVGMTNSCNACHPTRDDDEIASILEQWSADAADADGTFHGRTPAADMRGVVNAAVDGGVACVACHTTEGFVRGTVGGAALSQAAVDRILKEAIAREKGVTCDACHGARADGSLSLQDRQPLRLPKAELCGGCHNARTVAFGDFLARGEPLDHPTREMLDGTAGAEVPAGAIPGYGAYGDTFHSGFEDGCVTCHLDLDHDDGTHAFAAQVSTCSTCHQGLATFDRPADGDWDGDDEVAGIQTEVDGLLGLVRDAVLDADPAVSFDGEGFQRAGAAPGALTGASEAVHRAAFNWYTVRRDGSRGVHNASRAVQLLQRSYRELTGTDVPGAALR